MEYKMKSFYNCQIANKFCHFTFQLQAFEMSFGTLRKIESEKLLEKIPSDQKNSYLE